jgi:cobalt/nickel transport system permease protein
VRVLGEAAPQTWLTGRDDRARLLALTGLAVGMASLQSLPMVGASLGLALALGATSGAGPRFLGRRLLPMLGLLAPLLLLTPFWRPPGSEPLVAAWSWGPTREGLEATLLVGGRVLALGLVTIVALGLVPFERTVKGLQDLRVPGPLTHLALLTHRYLARFADDLQRTRHALTARGFRAGPNLETARTFGGVTGGLLVRSLVRTERVEQAMRCRGYAGRLVVDPPPPARTGDLLLALAGCGLGAGLVAADRWLQAAWPWA